MYTVESRFPHQTLQTGDISNGPPTANLSTGILFLRGGAAKRYCRV